MADKTSPEKAVKELTMLLMYLTRFNEKGRWGLDLDMAWKGYNFPNAIVVMSELT